MVSENPPPLHPFTGASVVLLLHGGQITGLMKLGMQSAGACWKHAGGSVMLVLPAGPGPEALTSWVAPTDSTKGELRCNARNALRDLPITISSPYVLKPTDLAG